MHKGLPRPDCRAALLAAMACCAGPVAAEELGRIEAQFGGKNRVWQTVAQARGGRVVATASLWLGPRMTELYLQGQAEEGDASRDVFSLSLRYLSPYAEGAAPVFADILYMPEGMGGPFWTSDGAADAPTIRVLKLEIWGAYGRIDALFAGELCLRERITAAPDPARCAEVTGRVETELFIE